MCTGSFPFFSVAKDWGVPYATVLKLAADFEADPSFWLIPPPAPIRPDGRPIEGLRWAQCAAAIRNAVVKEDIRRREANGEGPFIKNIEMRVVVRD